MYFYSVFSLFSWRFTNVLNVILTLQFPCAMVIQELGFCGL